MRASNELLEAITIALRRGGARFAFLHGSRVTGQAREGSDLDVAAYWGADPPRSWDVPLPEGVDLMVLDEAPLELRGRVAVGGEVLFEDVSAAMGAAEAYALMIGK